MIVNFFKYLNVIFGQRTLVYSMARRDISAKYVGSVFGMTWSVLQPLVMILVFWFIFSVGFRVVPKNDVPFVVWLTAGMAPWFAFADMINNATRAITSNANLVKKNVIFFRNTSGCQCCFRIVCTCCFFGNYSLSADFFENGFFFLFFSGNLLFVLYVCFNDWIFMDFCCC